MTDSSANSSSDCGCSSLHHRLWGKNVSTHQLNVHSSGSRPNSHNSSFPPRNSLLCMAQATMYPSNQKVNILFDSGSDRSYMTSACLKRIGSVPMRKEAISVSLFGESKPNSSHLRNVHQVSLRTLKGPIENMSVIESPTICAPVHRSRLPRSILDSLEQANFPLAHGSLVDSHTRVNIDLLIGQDHFWQFILPNIERVSEGLSAQESKFGWVLSGSWAENEVSPQVSHQFLCMTDIPSDLRTSIWDLDVIGISNPVAEPDSQTLNQFNNKIEFDMESSRYVVSLPWREGMKERLHNNVRSAHQRADSLGRKMAKNPELSAQYDSVLSDFESLGITHGISEEMPSEGPIFYLPHRPVVREDSLTTKVRPVFDASAKGHNGLSLNDCLEPGPNLIPNLPSVLLRFRRWKFGISADITKAFLQIKVSEADRDVHRFLWDVNGQRRHMRFDRVVFGNASSPFLLNATVRYHLDSVSRDGCYPSQIIKELSQNLYVDDWLSGVDNETDVLEVKAAASAIMEQGGFPLAKWGSNSSLLCTGTSTESSSDRKCAFDGDSLMCIKILGMQWDTASDSFYFEAQSMSNMLYTKRLVLSFIARIFDPLGFLNPFTVLIKVLFQDLWMLGLDWDEQLPPEFQRKMHAWVEGFQKIREWKIPRCISVHSWDGNDKELLCFSDASERAFGCSVYLKVKVGVQSKTTLVASRVRVAPLKKITLPRLELLGALLAARLLSFVKSSLFLDSSIPYSCFTDSTIALAWIKADPVKWKQFVRNRVSEIHQLTDPANWHHIPGTDNPADLLTRGISAADLTTSDSWLSGPKFNEMSDVGSHSELPSEQLLESEMVKNATALVSVTPSPPFDFERFSTLQSLSNTLAWILRFSNNAKLSPSLRIVSNTLSTEEIRAAEMCAFRLVQQQFEEYHTLNAGKVINKSHSLYKLSPFLDDNGLMRVGGRLQLSDLSYDAKHPIVLPKCHLSLLIVRFQHDLLKHAGVSTLLTTLRNKYWIIGARPLAKKVCRSCIPCKRQDSRPCQQVGAPLPLDRIRQVHVFAVTGLDHCGPVYCKDSNQKHYILLFTCAQVRAMHLELVCSLNVEEFMLAFRRFCARRGLPDILYSDNAKTFEASSKLIKQFGPQAPKWKNSIPLAPWYGGWWERLVRSTKSALRKTLGKALLDRSVLETVLFEVEASINSRPLTYVEEDSNPLTPSHFLLGRSSPLSSVHTDFVPKSERDFLLMKEEHSVFLDSFWTTWSEKYIRSLPSLGNGKSKMDLKVGSVVLIREEGLPRLKWPLAKVSDIIRSKDGLIRAVKLKTEKSELTRSVKKLHSLEVSEMVTPSDTPDLRSDNLPQQNTDSDPLSNIEDQPFDQVPVTSRSGRQIKPRSVLDL